MLSEVASLRDGRLLTVRLTRPDKRNAMTHGMYAACAAALTAAESDGTEIIVLTGEGEDFCAGNDLSDFISGRPQEEALPVHDFLHAIATSTRILVAAVQGKAVGVGATMLLHCDFVVAAENAVLVFPFVDLSLVPEAGSSLLLPLRIGHLRAAEALMLCRPLDAVRAQALGLVTQLASPGQGQAAADELCKTLLMKPAGALLETKRLMRLETASVLARMAEEKAAFAAKLREPEARAMIDRFLANRAKAR